MKRLILLLCQCIAIIAELGPWLDDASAKVANKFLLPKANAKNCFIETKITLIDLALIGQLFKSETLGIENPVFKKIGCLYACVFKKKGWLSGTHLNVQKLKEKLSPKRSNPKRHNEILEKCTNYVKSSTNECDVMINLIKCMIFEQNLSRS